MIYAVLTAEGQPTGAIYTALNDRILAHHAAYDEAIEPGAALINDGTDDAPAWRLVPASIEALRDTWVASRFQARSALRAAGLFDAAEAAVRDSGDADLIEAWDSAAEWRRLSPSIARLGVIMGLDDEAIDALFIAASKIFA
ncbi:hypothetical protein PARHAE_02436 [Paracoccus haematequi]|uniref:Uncharacterized protein n=1 Tax=Paracoccus haematequi TaxID=2491866 RepID=A0A447IP52_9RHOB|nr:hypothetical protein [Paracoccus haematequi]VDS09244.1 hypothetical protein PARHAE_02436 [Paracoccus haematequi]